MGDAGGIARTAPDRPGAVESPLRTLAALRIAGAHQCDPVRFHYLEALSSRVQTQPDAVRRILEARLRDALVQYVADVDVYQPVAPAHTSRSTAELAELNRHFRSVLDGVGGKGLNDEDGEATEMRSLRRVSVSLRRISAARQLGHAMRQGPENAGPLKSHRLVLQSFALMRKLSPDYLGRFMSYLDLLLWLEQADGKSGRLAGKPRTARRKRAQK